MARPATTDDPRQLSLFGDAGNPAPVPGAVTSGTRLGGAAEREPARGQPAAQPMATPAQPANESAAQPANAPSAQPADTSAAQPTSTPAQPPAAAPATASAGHTPAIFAHPRAQRETWLDGHRVAYEFRRARRRSIGFVVGEHGLSVSAPRWVGMGEIEAALREKAGWILRKLHEQRERQRRLVQSRIEWRDGVAIPFLGENVIVVIDPRVTGAILNSDAQGLPGVPRLTLHVGLPHGVQPEQLREAVQGWLQRQALRIFEERCALYAERLGVRVRRLSLSAAATRWGSASADGAIRLNWRLVHFGLPIIDYVVTHELAHLREMNHSGAFWDVVRSVLPGFEQARGQLRQELLPVMD